MPDLYATNVLPEVFIRADSALPFAAAYAATMDLNAAGGGYDFLLLANNAICTQAASIPWTCRGSVSPSMRRQLPRCIAPVSRHGVKAQPVLLGNNKHIVGLEPVEHSCKPRTFSGRDAATNGFAYDAALVDRKACGLNFVNLIVSALPDAKRSRLHVVHSRLYCAKSLAYAECVLLAIELVKSLAVQSHMLLSGPSGTSKQLGVGKKARPNRIEVRCDSNYAQLLIANFNWPYFHG